MWPGASLQSRLAKQAHYDQRETGLPSAALGNDHHVCSLFARLPRYRPSASGTTRQESEVESAQTGIGWQCEGTDLIAEQRTLNPRVYYPNRPPTPRGTTS